VSSLAHRHQATNTWLNSWHTSTPAGWSPQSSSLLTVIIIGIKATAVISSQYCSSITSLINSFLTIANQ